MDENKDIFDRIMELPGLKYFNSWYYKHKEVLLYLFFGGVSFILNIVLFALFINVVGMNALAGNVVDWVLCVLFQFFTNRTWVFDGRTDSLSQFLKQMGSFFGGRFFTLVIEEIILAVFITWLGLNSIVVKLAAQVVVIVLNYIISKVIVFRKK